MSSIPSITNIALSTIKAMAACVVHKWMVIDYQLSIINDLQLLLVV